MPVEFRPLTPALGAEVLGVDLSREQPAEVMDAIARAWERYAVLVFRDQQITPDDQRRFVGFFGPFQAPRAGPREGQDTMFIGNVEVDGLPSDLPNGEMWFHQDGCYTEQPTKQSFLYSLEIPSQGGNTKFASTARAYAQLPADLRTRLLDLDVHFTFDYSAVVRDANWKAGPQYTHPLVIAHHATGEPLLFCNRLMANEIVGLPKPESDALIEELCVALEREDNVFEHVWRVGDLVIWDNLATVHARTDFDPREHRLLRRMTTRGTKPVAYRDAVRVTASR
jgi:taurine dioxygenase